MLHHRRQGHCERPGELADGDAFLFAQARKDRAPGAVGQRRKGLVEARSIVNHVVKYRRAAGHVKASSRHLHFLDELPVQMTPGWIRLQSQLRSWALK